MSRRNRAAPCRARRASRGRASSWRCRPFYARPTPTSRRRRTLPTALPSPASSCCVTWVELRTIVQSVDPRVISFQDEEVLSFQKNVVLPDDLPLHGGQCDPQLFGGWADDGSGLEQYDPVFLADVVRVDRNVVDRHLSSEQP